MAKFCSKCGNPLIEGEPCANCAEETMQQDEQNQHQSGGQNQQQGDQYKQQAQQVADKTVNELKKIFQKVKQMLKDPGKEIPAMTRNKDKKLSLEIISAKALIISLLTLLLLVKLENDIGFELEKTKLFFLVFIITFAQDIVLAVSLLISNRFIFKEKNNFTLMMAVVSPKAIFDIMIYIVAFIISIFNGGLGLAIILFGPIVNFLFCYKAYESTSNVSVTNKLYGFIIGMLIFIIIESFIFWIFKDSMVSSIENMLYNAISRGVEGMLEGFFW